MKTEIATDLSADETRPAEERACRRLAVARGLESPSRADCLRAVGRALRMTGSSAGHVGELGLPESPEESRRWAGWCRQFTRRGWCRIYTGPNGGVSSRSLNSWVAELAVARRFGFCPGRLASAVRVAREEAARLGLTLARWHWAAVVRPKASRTRRAVRRIWIASRALEAKPIRTGDGDRWHGSAEDLVRPAGAVDHCKSVGCAVVRLCVGQAAAMPRHERELWQIAQLWAGNASAGHLFGRRVAAALEERA